MSKTAQEIYDACLVLYANDQEGMDMCLNFHDYQTVKATEDEESNRVQTGKEA